MTDQRAGAKPKKARITDRTQRRGDESRKRIIKATLEVASKVGYDGTTLGRITKRAKVPMSSVYWHFANKDELLAAALRHSYEQWRRGVPKSYPATTGPLAQRLEGQLLVRRHLTKRPPYWHLGLMLALEQRAEEPAARVEFRAIRADAAGQIRRWWATVLELPEDDPTSDVLARLTLAAVDGLFIAWRDEETIDLDALFRLVAAGLARVAEELLAGRVRLSSADAPAGAGAAPPDGEVRGAEGEPADGVRPEASSRDRLIRAAARVATTRGYAGTTISRICAEAGLPASSLYWFFKDKDALLGAVVEQGYEEWRAIVGHQQPPPAGAHWSDVLRSRVLRSHAGLDAHDDFLRIGHLLLLEDRTPVTAGRAAFQDVRRKVRATTVSVLRDTPWRADACVTDPADALARVFMAFNDGLLVSRQVDDQQGPSFADLTELVIVALEGAHAELAGPEALTPDDSTETVGAAQR